jgi:hypothetical protein
VGAAFSARNIGLNRVMMAIVAPLPAAESGPMSFQKSVYDDGRTF